MTTHDATDPWTACDCWYCTAQRILYAQVNGSDRL